MHIIIHLGVLAVTILALSRVLPSVHIKGVGTAVSVAVVFSVLNFFLGWLIRAFLFVPALFTLGLLFLVVPLIVNTVLLWLTDKLLANFEIRTLSGLTTSAVAITVVNWLFYVPFLSGIASGHCHMGCAGSRWI